MRTILVRNLRVLRVLSQIRNWYTYKLADVHSLNGITTRRHHAGQVDACSSFFTSNDFNDINRFYGLAQVAQTAYGQVVNYSYASSLDNLRNSNLSN